MPDTGPPPRGRAPYTERIAGWSARHRKTAVLGWLALTAAAFFGGGQGQPPEDGGLAVPSAPSGDPLGVRRPAAGRRACIRHG